MACGLNVKLQSTELCKWLNETQFCPEWYWLLFIWAALKIHSYLPCVRCFSVHCLCWLWLHGLPLSMKSCLLDYSWSHPFNGLSFCFCFCSKLSIPASGLMVMFAVVHYHCVKQEKRGTHQRAFFLAKVSRMSESWGWRAIRRKRLYEQSRLWSLVSNVTVYW